MPRKRPAVPLEGRDWYTPAEAAARLWMSPATLYRRVVAREISCIILPHSQVTVFSKAAIERIRQEELGIANDSDDPPWPAAGGALPPGARITTTLEVSRG